MEGVRDKHVGEVSGGGYRNSQVGRKDVIRNLVPCIGKSSYSSAPIGILSEGSSFIFVEGFSRGGRLYFYSNFTRSFRTSLYPIA